MASDVYSLGLVCYEMLTWQLPWRGTPFQVGLSRLIFGHFGSRKAWDPG